MLPWHEDHIINQLSTETSDMGLGLSPRGHGGTRRDPLRVAATLRQTFPGLAPPRRLRWLSACSDGSEQIAPQRWLQVSTCAHNDTGFIVAVSL